MWKVYSKEALQHNRSSNRSVMAVILVAVFFLSFLCTLSYNLFSYDTERIINEEGSWHGQIVKDLTDEEILIVENFSNVAHIQKNETLSDGSDVVFDIYLQNPRTVYDDMPKICQRLGISEKSVHYNEQLLSQYLILNPEDKSPPLLIPFFLVVLFCVCLSLVLIIRNAFELSMEKRIRHYGMLSGIGATPAQIRTGLLQEAAVLSIIPVGVGCLAGILAGWFVVINVNYLAADIPGRQLAEFTYHPIVLGMTLSATLITVFFAAWLPTRKVSKVSPIEAIRYAEEPHVKKSRRARVLACFFGVSADLALNALKSRKKSMRFSHLALILAFLSFTLMLNLTTLSEISTELTYFQKYQDVWDVMLTVKDTALDRFSKTSELKTIPDTEQVVLYQKEKIVTELSKSVQNPSIKTLANITEKRDAFQMAAEIVIMDDESFFDYCSQIGIIPDGGGVIMLNRIWDSENSSFRHKQYIPLLSGTVQRTTFLDEKGNQVSVPVLACTDKVPILRESFDENTMVYFMPASLWQVTVKPISDLRTDLFISCLASDREDLHSLDAIENTALQIVSPDYQVESENRIQEAASNRQMFKGLQFILGGFCILLAIIGIAGIFFNTLGFVRQRRREFAQYLSVGMTPTEMRYIFIVEAIIIAGKPILITLLLNGLAVWLMLRASELDAAVFLQKVPIMPIVFFAVGVILAVVLAYYWGGRRLINSNLCHILKNDL